MNNKINAIELKNITKLKELMSDIWTPSWITESDKTVIDFFKTRNVVPKFPCIVFLTEDTSEAFSSIDIVFVNVVSKLNIPDDVVYIESPI